MKHLTPLAAVLEPHVFTKKLVASSPACQSKMQTLVRRSAFRSSALYPSLAISCEPAQPCTLFWQLENPVCLIITNAWPSKNQPPVQRTCSPMRGNLSQLVSQSVICHCLEPCGSSCMIVLTEKLLGPLWSRSPAQLTFRASASPACKCSVGRGSCFVAKAWSTWYSRMSRLACSLSSLKIAARLVHRLDHGCVPLAAGASGRYVRLTSISCASASAAVRLSMLVVVTTYLLTGPIRA